MSTLYIPPKDVLSRTSCDDPIFHYYYPIVSYIYRLRLKNTLSLLGKSYDNLLEIGYGSGIFFPEVSKRSQQVYGLDVHGNENLVRKMLKSELISNVILKSGSILNIPFEDRTFDCIVSVSTLEHLTDLDRAMQEIKRILKNNGEAILSFPARNLITDTIYKIWGSDPRHIHPSSHYDIINAIQKYFTIDKILKCPRLSSIQTALYITIKCKPA